VWASGLVSLAVSGLLRQQTPPLDGPWPDDKRLCRRAVTKVYGKQTRWPLITSQLPAGAVA
jgi:hypothetical protein